MAHSTGCTGGIVELMYFSSKTNSLASVKKLKKNQDENKCGSRRQCKKLRFPIFVLIQQAYRSLGANP